MTTFNIPWKCLDHNPEPQTAIIEPHIAIIEPPKPLKTFAQALTNICDIPLSQIQQLVVKGDRLAIEIPEAAYEAGLEACKHNLHGRILWPKGSTPLSVVALKAKLALIWKDLSNWGIISLGRGYFEFTFSSLEDVRRVRSIPSWNLNPGRLKFFAWSKDFNPKMQHNTSVQVWVKIFGLSQEYWHKTILFTIAGSLGTPICIDSVTAKPMHEHTFCQFARVLIDIDLMQPLRHKLLVERKGFAFFVDLEYEHIPAFCSECKMIGHSIENCRRWGFEENSKANKDNNKNQKAPEKKKVYVPTHDGRPLQSRAIINVEKEVINVEKEVINVEDHNRKSPQHIIVEPNNNECVSVTNCHEIVPAIPNNNANPVLSPVSPQELLRLQDKELENELNDNTEDDWCTDSNDDTFVDTTQLFAAAGNEAAVNNNDNEPSQLNSPISQLDIRQAATVPIDVVVGKIDESVLTPDRVAKDMAFLKESWANMTEANETLQNVANEVNSNLNADSNDQGFQIHLSKNQKKAQKKMKRSSRESYATRSKVPPKPFR
ncbi:hypothetical protein QL285_027819 [Trifolium repens]|nr:hypothetical protein QL285_027819 [Trifolium repens]